MIATAARAIIMETIDSPKGEQGGDHCAKEDQQNYEGHWDAEPLSICQVTFCQFEVFMVNTGVSADEHSEVIPLVRLFYGVDDVSDVGRGFLGRTGQRVMQHDGVLACGN